MTLGVQEQTALAADKLVTLGNLKIQTKRGLHMTRPNIMYISSFMYLVHFVKDVLCPAGVSAPHPQLCHVVRHPQRRRADAPVVGDAASLLEYLANTKSTQLTIFQYVKGQRPTCPPALGPSCAESHIPLSHLDPETLKKMAWSTE
jgi:hypothetical protein